MTGLELRVPPVHFSCAINIRESTISVNSPHTWTPKLESEEGMYVVPILVWMVDGVTVNTTSELLNLRFILGNSSPILQMKTLRLSWRLSWGLLSKICRQVDFRV